MSKVLINIRFSDFI